MLAFIIDLILVVILAIGVIVGIKRGFIASISKPVRRILAILIAFSCAASVGAVIVSPLISEPITTRITESLYANCPDITADTAVAELPLILKMVAGMAGVDISEAAEGTDDVIKALVEVISAPAIQAISSAIAFVLLFILSNLLLRLLFFILNHYSQEGILGIINRGVGCLINMLFAFVIDWLLVSVFAFLLDSALLSSTEWAVNFYGGFVYRFFDTLNPLELLLKL